ncbi:nicotinamide riboside transporter PnuC [Xylanimonas protaetiae]|uniref:Nicotinamide riboside transporter PnuC n=1 Tax=Xylanimonas protaetiae TaxID=2509457 RepID=A0A4V0YG29_9MICO|nr:nicotinamide riboside transporter PnuC [Xylanimonas protaetiae]QAY69771.1 nicotinamide riboside transporter PnuC [Xylanimonas protaetiae]
MDIFEQFLNAKLTIGNDHMLWREIVGNVFGLVSALGGMRRKVWSWPVGIVGNVLLFTVFLGSWFGMAGEHPDMLGQAGRQIMFVLVSVYGWYRWNQTRRTGGADAVAVHPRWASWPQRLGLVAAMATGTAAFAWVFQQLDSWAPVPDAWIFMGSVLATYGMARGWVEFWLIWVAVDAVGVPLLFRGGYYATGLMYVFYGVFTIVGFVVWWRINRRESAAPAISADSPAAAAI